MDTPRHLDTAPPVAPSPQKKRLKMPDAYVLLFLVALVCAIATYIVPSGAFDRVTNDEITTTVPGSYHTVERSPVTFVGFFSAIAEGMANAGPIIFLILFTGGAIAVLEQTGAITGMVHSIVNKFRERQFLFILIVAAIFSILGTTGIVVNSVIGFIPLGIIVARALKWDAMLGAAVIYLGTYAGFNSTLLSPSPLGISQTIAELPLFSGIGLRTVIYICFVAATIVYLASYARRLKSDKGSLLGSDWFPSKALVSDTEDSENVVWTGKQKLIILVTALCLAGFLVGTFQLGWGDKEMAGTFILIAIIAGLIGGMGGNGIAKTFIGGCQKLVYGALICGMARCISIILDDGNILDTIVNGLANLLQGHGPIFVSVGMYLVSALLHFLISSGSGESVVLIPILAPLSDLLGVTRQVTVQAVMMGEGVVNCLNPTSGVLMAILAATGIPYTRWLKFMWPLALTWFLIGLASIIVGVLIKWGPF
ncbi:YfcC family protein [Paenibacillus sp. WLX2291]|uniref:YfcC family protein n=1 Tax=Paenibacillus sp. WLX2291 TaxID=3296934 RepID=UPI0039840481